jgi:hypothetical protein
VVIPKTSDCPVQASALATQARNPTIHQFKGIGTRVYP